MSVFSVAEDFSYYTLKAVPGLWGKVRYVSGLRQQDGRYEHWGLARKYGTDAAQSAIVDAHHSLLMQVLRMPLVELLKETEEAASQENISFNDYVRQLAAEGEGLLPASVPEITARHFMTVLQSLSSLAQGCMGANLQAS